MVCRNVHCQHILWWLGWNLSDVTWDEIRFADEGMSQSFMACWVTFADFLWHILWHSSHSDSQSNEMLRYLEYNYRFFWVWTMVTKCLTKAYSVLEVKSYIFYFFEHFMCMQNNQVMATYRRLKQPLSLESRVKHGAVSGYTAALNHPSLIQKFAFDLLFFFSPCSHTCNLQGDMHKLFFSFWPQYAGQVSDLFTFSLFWN